jgi:uncharacterized iron-regulated protein
MNHIKTLLINSLIILSLTVTGQKKAAYQLFTADGKKVNYGKLLKAAEKADMLLFGELHNNPIAHWLQYEVTSDLHTKRKLILGAEMFEADNQKPLDDYLAGKIDAKGLDTLARLWNNYKTDYAPLVNFAKANDLRFIATNIPRKYASQVFKADFASLENLPAEEKRWIAPLPIDYDPELPGYKNMLTMMGGGRGETFPKAQAIKDATMAHFILQNYEEGKVFIHYHGTYHTDNFEGILWYLKRKQPGLKYITVSTVEQSDLSKLKDDHRGKADFILAIDENMTKTY